MTNFYPKVDNGIATADFESFPEEFGDAWILIHKFKNHPQFLYMFSMYFNDDFERGTVIVSPYYYHRYPDIYSLYAKPDKDGTCFGIRTSINPKYRGMGLWVWYSYMTRLIFWGNLNTYVDATPERNKSMERAYQKAAETIGQNKVVPNDGRIALPEEEMPRDSAFPYIWYNQRIGGKVK